MGGLISNGKRVLQESFAFVLNGKRLNGHANSDCNHCWERYHFGMIAMIEEPVTVARAAEILGVSEMRVRQLCQRGLLGKKVGVQWLMTETEINSFKPNHKRIPGPEKKSQNPD